MCSSLVIQSNERSFIMSQPKKKAKSDVSAAFGRNNSTGASRRNVESISYYTINRDDDLFFMSVFVDY